MRLCGGGWALALGLLKRQGKPRNLDDLLRVDVVAMSAVGGRSEWQLTDPDGVGQVFRPQPRLVVDDLQTLKLAMLAGTGVGMLPSMLSQAERQADRQAKLLMPVLPEWRLPPGQVHAVFASRRGQGPAVRCFLDFLGAILQGEQLLDKPVPVRA